MTKKQKKNLTRIIIALVVFFAVFIIDVIIDLNQIIKGDLHFLLPLLIYLSIYLFIGYDVILKAFRNLFHGALLDENFLMVIATIGAFGVMEFKEGVAVLLFYQVGEFFQDYAVKKSRKSIASLMDIRPDYANLLLEGKSEIVDPQMVHIGDYILVKPGEKIPLDGVVVSGSSEIDNKALTGESIPVEVIEGSNVISGTINLTGTLKVKVMKEYQDSTVSKILDLVENATSKKSKSENFITKFARFYTPLVVAGAVLLTIIPGAITGEWVLWLTRALNFLVVSCPCALVISIPLSFFASIGGASKKGILIKGSSYIEKFNQANIFAFDKTGTLTKGNFEVIDVSPKNNKEEILRTAAICEKNSNHPIGLSIKKAYGKEIKENMELIDLGGKGIIAKGENTLCCGNEKLMKEMNIPFETTTFIGTKVYVASNGRFLGCITIADEIKEEAKEMISYLNRNGAKTIMLTGDNETICKSVANELGVKEYKASLLPNDKVSAMEKIMNEKNKNDVVCFVGDGINDAPVLMQSDIGLAMGALGSDAAIEASDIVLMKDDLLAIPLSKKIAKKTMKIVKENIIFALTVKAVILILSIFGMANMWLAIFADVGVSIIAILNAMRTNGRYE